MDSELPSDSWNISPHGPMAPGTPEQASGHTGWIPCLADRRIDCMIAPARRQACSSTIGWWEVHARIWISRVGLSIAHWARTWIMGIHDLDPSRIPTLHCPSHTALNKDPAYHVGSSWIFVHIYGWPDPFIFVFFFNLRLISLMNPKSATVVFFCMRLEKITFAPQVWLHITPLASDRPRLKWSFPQRLWWVCAPFAQYTYIEYILRIASVLGGLMPS